MNVAIYSRKSRLSDKGESIQNQIEMCKKYCNDRYGDCQFLVYQDEGFSGGNTERPAFSKMIKDAKNKKFDKLVCYRLDRISRNVVDFSSTFKMLNSHNIDFISITEHFDTGTPMGTAMIHISSVFAQLERDTIAERIQDNLAELAKTGRYLGHRAPDGYQKIKKSYQDANGKEKFLNIFQIDPEPAKKIKYIFDQYLKYQSIKKLEGNFVGEGIRTNNGNYYKCVSIRRVLTHPIYAQANADTYNYFKDLGCEMIDPIDKFTGETGIYIFRRFENKEKGCIEKDHDKWMIGAGSHDYIVPADDWIKTQKIIQDRSELNFRRPIGTRGLLSGVLRCKYCGDYMRPLGGKKGYDFFYYVCATKEMSRKHLCSCPNTRADKLDIDVIKIIKSSSNAETSVKYRLAESKKRVSAEFANSEHRSKEIHSLIEEKKRRINNILKKLEDSDSGALEAHIIERVNELDDEIKKLNKELLNIENKKESLNASVLSRKIFEEAVNNFIYKENEMDFIEKRNAIKTIIKNIYWDGKEIVVEFNDI